MLTPTEEKILAALDKPMTRTAVALKLGYKPDSINPSIKKLLEFDCIREAGVLNRSKVYEATGNRPRTKGTLGFTVLGVRI
jgi:predicted transcriptional regulator